MVSMRVGLTLLALVVMTTTLPTTRPGAAASAVEIDRDVTLALARLYGDVPDVRPLAERAKGVLVFPSIVKAGFLFGAQYGDGALRRQGTTVGYYNTVAASSGFRAGGKPFGYLLIFMSDAALGSLDKAGGFEIGDGTRVVVLDAAEVKALTTTTEHDIYALLFDRSGLVAGAGLDGTKISRIDR
jgi:lipid-binding SYLF domain-containing protein